MLGEPAIVLVGAAQMGGDVADGHVEGGTVEHSMSCVVSGIANVYKR